MNKSTKLLAFEERVKHMKTLLLGKNSYEPHEQSETQQIDSLYHEYVSQSSPFLDDVCELHEGLVDKSWKRRLSTLIKLLETITNVESLDTQSIVTKEILCSVTANLGHTVSSVSRVTLDVILAFIDGSHQPEVIINDVIQYGIDGTTVDSNLSSNVIRTLPVLLKHAKKRGKNISHQLLAKIVTSLAKRMVQITHQRQVITSLLRIKTIIGDSMFDHFMETYYPQVKRDLDVLSNVYGTEYSDDLSDFSDAEFEADSFFVPDDIVHDIDDAVDEVDIDNLNVQPEYVEDTSSLESNVIMKVYDEDGNEIKRRTSSRRVTFGGEIVKIRTPDSDRPKEKLDISADICIHISSDESVEDDGIECVEALRHQNKAETVAKVQCSRIPLPIRPALNRPQYPGHKFPPFRQPSAETLNGSKSKMDRELLMGIPNYEGESLTSSSDSSDRSRTRPEVQTSISNDQQKLFTLTVQDLSRMKINDKVVLENLFKKDDWRCYICAAERLTQILRQPYCIQNISSNMDTSTGVSLLGYVLNVLSETMNNRVITSSLRVLRFLCQAMQASTLALYLNTVVPTFSLYLDSTHEYNVRLQAAEILKMLMRRFSPQKIVDFLFTKQCFFSKNSKIRENSLLFLMYALITFPSTEFSVNEITEVLIKHAVTEPKMRVRYALLETLSILGQLVPKSKFNIVVSDHDSMFFKKALRARLTRRQLPTVSQSGVIQYAFQITPATAFGIDIEWILAGKGSVSDNICKSKAQINYKQDDDISPTDFSDKRTFTNSTFEVRKKKTSPNFCKRTIRGNSDERLHRNDKLLNLNVNNVERYSADWTDFRSSSYFEVMRAKYPSNLSDTSSYESSYKSEQNFLRLNPAYEPINSSYLDRPVSEDKLNRIPWTSKLSKLPLRLKPSGCPTFEYYDYNTSVSLPVLNKRDGSYRSFYQTEKEVNNYLSGGKKNKWTRNREEQTQRSNFENEDEKSVIDSQQILRKSTNEYGIIQDKKTWSNRNTIMSGGTETKNISINLGDKFENIKENFDKMNETLNDRIQQPTEIKSKSYSFEPREKINKILEKRAGIKLKRSLTKEIKMPKNTFSFNINDVPPFYQPKESIKKTLVQFESNEWEAIIEALQGVIILAKHHNKLLSPCLHTFVIAVAKEIGNLRSQVARAACLSAESIFKHMSKMSDQDIEELSHALFLRTADTNKFIREDSNKALDAMIGNIKFSKAIIILTQKVSNHPNGLIRASAARLMNKVIQGQGLSRILSMTKEKKELVVNTLMKFLNDSNLETRTYGKKIFQFLAKDQNMFQTLTEIIPSSVLMTINKSLSRTNLQFY